MAGRNLIDRWRRGSGERAGHGLSSEHAWRRSSNGARRTMIALGAVSCFCLAPAVAPSIAQATPCTTANPASNYSGNYPSQGETVAQTDEKFDEMRKAEGCNEPMVLPENYLSMTEQEQFFTLYNLEREARGLAPLKLDRTLLSQISFNHSKEIATYEYFTHESPINRPENSPVFGRFTVNPVFKEVTGWGETGVFGINTGECETENHEKIKCELKIPVANFIAAFMYGDGPGENANPECKGAVTTGCWGHRDTILGNFNWIGIGVSPKEPVTSDFALLPANYTPPPTADTNPPEISAVSYANGTATATGVKDSPLNVNDTGEKPLTAGITQVVFYVNKIVYPEENGNFNTVEATESPAGSGTWTASITVKEGETLHAVAVDGSGNFTDMTETAGTAPTVSEQAPSEVTQTSATFHATVNPTGSNVTSCTFEYGKNLSYGSSVPCSALPGSGTSPVAVSAAASGLSPGTGYFVRISATNSTGNSQSSYVYFKTQAPPAVIEAPTEVTSTAATFHGMVNPGGSNVTKCTFEYGKNLSYGSSVPCSALPGSGTSPVAVSAAASSLSPGTGYFVRISETNSNGTSESTYYYFKTLEATVVIQAPSEVTKTSATFHATVNPGGSNVTECKFEYGKNLSYGSSVPCSALPGSGTSPVAISAAASGLKAGTGYFVRISATNSKGTAESSYYYFKTLE